MKGMIILSSLLLFYLGNSMAGDFYVDAAMGNNTTGNGSKENPWFTISFALSRITGSGHTIHVAPGTYDTVMDGVFPEIFPLLINSGISLVGAGSDSTIIDAKSTNTVIRCENITGTQIMIEGLTIRNGKGGDGGGLTVLNSNVFVHNNVFNRNECFSGSGNGGAIFIDDGTCTVAENSFTDNDAHTGGALAVNDGTVLITQNEFIGNSATFAGAAFYMRTGTNTNVEIVENIFRANVVSFDNEDIYIGSYLSQSSLSPLISRNIITSGVNCENSKPRLLNNTFAGTGGKTAIRINNASPAIVNNIIANWSNGIREENATSDPDTVAYNLFFNNT
ncbi:MAG: DUF1565 domain-containing protein, partial [Anaerolineae bacterium]|nr:DUF1565 domain-containing protein [Anaerolineae bacterium]